MKVEVLLATMYQKDEEIVKKANLETDAVVVNQCHQEEKKVITIDNNKRVLFIDTIERGLSKSRNMALKNASKEICVLCDDDETFVDGYEKIITTAFSEIPEADLIVFNVNRIDKNGNNLEKRFKKVRKVPYYKTYGSVHIAFKREIIERANISFNTDFGAGSGKYKMAEDALFFMNCHKAGLKAYIYPEVIATVMQIDSSWFTGYDEQYFYDVGAYLAAAFPFLNCILKYYYPLRLHKHTSLGICKQLKLMNNGIKGYKNRISFEQYKGEK